ncbi:MAG: hypothetical protein A4E66_01828 [Syntrophus sp. PtaB.Bin001]|nr:MAG: hypothetical protein A4E66_01828 [Syntrophus sp. PtaB.Bin001]
MSQDLIFEKISTNSLCRWFTVPFLLWTLLFSANIFDYYVTRHVLSHGGCELNPIVEILFKVEGFNAVLTTKIFFLTILLILLPFIKHWKLILLKITTFVYLALATYQICGTCFVYFI